MEDTVQDIFLNYLSSSTTCVFPAPVGGATILPAPDGSGPLPGAVVNVPLTQVGPSTYRSAPLLAVTAPPEAALKKIKAGAGTK